MHRQHPQTAYRKYAILIGAIFENCDRRRSTHMNLGILGTGSIARTMAAEFAKVPTFHCAAVCSRQKATGEALAQSVRHPEGLHRPRCHAGRSGHRPHLHRHPQQPALCTDQGGASGREERPLRKALRAHRGRGRRADRTGQRDVICSSSRPSPRPITPTTPS